MGLSPVKSPPSQSYTSPRKLLDELGSAAAKSPPPAYQRYFGLVASGKSGLILPYKYRTLAELFRSVDTASSMMFTRKEVVTFAKLKQPVIELCKRNLTEAHLGQIQTVLPDAFKFSQEKVHQFGQTDKYQLVVTPTIAGNDWFCTIVLLERKRRFYQALVERVKDHHEVLLKSLDPPMIVPRDKLTRWHPEFDVESCPDIEPSPLPQPPNIEKLSTARDVLNKAREMFTVNPRMEKALQKLSENSNSASQPATSAAAVIPSLASALKGIPKSLLEKVRARQAAKALELLTQGQEQSKECVRLRRLPELARILRNLYVTEKKSVLLMDAVITKMCSCYREILSPGKYLFVLKLFEKKICSMSHHFISY
ncbi:hypothetical protein AAG570_013701 [Ranatra chinensis]|uniref:CDT1 Geminin-binding domain-containing protein n=1 Tax=Ranatra chinensis TaxID=642074 RepID=A0ABD0YD77_9HEMI